MVTAIIVKEKIQGLIAKSNNITGNSDTTLTDAVDALVEGYGTGSENLDAELAEQEALIDELKEKLANGGGDNTVVDVDVLPTENIDQSKIYRVTKQGEEKAEVWVVSSDMNFAGTFEEFNALNGATDVVEYIIVDEIPTPHDGPHDGILPVYIIRSTGNIYVSTGVNTGVYIGEQFPGGYRGFISDTSEATEDGLYTIMSSAETSTTYGIPDEADNKTVYEHTSATGWKELGAGGGSGIIDVTELPEVGVEGSFYRLTTEVGAEVYIVNNGTTVTAAEFLGNMMGGSATYRTKNYVVKTLPETLAGYAVIDGFPTFSLYIIEETGIVYASFSGGSAETAGVGSEIFGVEDRGWVDNIDDVDKANAGVYCAAGEPNVDLFSYSNGEWVKYIDQNTYETEIDERDIRLAPVNFEEYVILDDAGTTITGVSDKTLKSVEIPSNITALGVKAFEACEELKFVIFEENSTLTTISDRAFVSCADLKSIVIPDGVPSIGNGVFAGCSNLESITIPNSVTSIGEWAFQNCSSLESITIPNSVTSIGETAFYVCANLTIITFTGTMAQWKAITKGDFWDSGTGNYIITCTDGTIAKDGTETTA